MRLLDIENHLRQILPLFTDKFNDWIDSTISVSSGVATITTSEAHGLKPGDKVNIKDVVFQNPITSLVSTSGTVQATTQYNSDLTTPFNGTVDISGADQSQFNGVFDLIQVADRKNFYYETEAFYDATATGTPVLNEKNLLRYNYFFEVQTVTNSLNYTINVQNIADFTSTCKSANFKSRITTVFSFDQAVDHYTKQDNDDYFLFLIREETEVSKNRQISSDFTERMESGEEFRQETEHKFLALVMARTSPDVTMTEAADDLAVDIQIALQRTLMGYTPAQTNAGCYSKLTFNGDLPFDYNRAVYTHGYRFACTLDLRDEDTFVPLSAAVQEIDVTYFDNNTNNQLEIANDNLKY